MGVLGSLTADDACFEPVPHLQAIELGGNVENRLAAHILDVWHQQALRRVHGHANVVLGLHGDGLTLAVDVAAVVVFG